MTAGAAIAAIAGAAYIFGALALRSLPTPDIGRLPRFALEMIAGIGILGALLSLLLFAGRASLQLPLAAIAAVAGLAWAVFGARASTGPEQPRTLVLVNAILAAAAVGAIAPVTDDDALAYVLPIAHRIAAAGTLKVWADQARSMWPQGQTLLLALVSAHGGTRLGIVSAGAWLLAIGTVGALSVRLCEARDRSAIAVAIALGAPVTAVLVSSAKEDLLVVAAAAAAVFCLCGTGKPIEVACAGLFAGTAAGAKYPGAAVPAACAVWILAAHGARRWRDLAVFGASAAAIAGVWYAANTIRFGNPVAPFFAGASGTPFDARLSREYVDSFGAPRSFVGFWITPLRIFVQPELYCGRGALFSPVALAGVAAVAVPGLRQRHRIALSIAGMLYVAWFFTMQNARLLLPAAVLVSPAAADVLGRLARRSAAAATLAVACCAGVLLPPIVGAVRAARYLSEPSTFLDRETQRYADVRWMNARLDPRSARVASTFKVIGYLDAPALILDPTYETEISSAELADPARLLAAWRRLGITHVWAPPDGFPELTSALERVYANPASRLGGVRFFRDPPFEPTAVFRLTAPTDAVR